MEKDTIEQLFNRLDGQLDTANPKEGHRDNFLAKLQAQSKGLEIPSGKTKTNWKPIAIAASMLLVAALSFLSLTGNPNVSELADISPEMEQTQDFFTQIIEKELFQINEEATPETKKMVEDAIAQLDILEADYDHLKKDLATSGEDQRVVYAMVENFQNLRLCK